MSMPAVPDFSEDSNLPLARSPLAQWHTQHGARLDEIDSWQVPVVYKDEVSEVAAARSGLAIADVSFTTKVMLRGPGVAELTQALTSDSRAGKPGGVAQMMGDNSALACRLQTDQLLILGGPANNSKLESSLSAALGDEDDGVPEGLSRWLSAKQILEINLTSAYASFWIFGPHTDELLRRLTHFDIACLIGGRAPNGGESPEAVSCAQTGLASVPAILVRPPTPAIPSMRILTGWDVAEYVWEKLFQAGQEWKVTPLGVDALDTLLS
jgi:glycine cleavage system aminomethyltransferase T